MIKALKDFKVYILPSQVIEYVPTIAVKDILTEEDSDGKRAKWITILLEYDLEINPTKLVRWQGLANMMTQSNCDVLGVNLLDCGPSASNQNEQVTIYLDFLALPWYKVIIYVL